MDDNSHYPRFNSQSRGFSISSSDSNKPTHITTSLQTERGSTYSGVYQGQAFPRALPTNNRLYQPRYARDQLQQNLDTYHLDGIRGINRPIQNFFDSTSQFQTRQPSAMQTLSVDTPDEPISTLGLLSLQHHGSLGYSNLYPQQQVTQPLDSKKL